MAGAPSFDPRRELAGAMNARLDWQRYLMREQLSRELDLRPTAAGLG
jgi:hypothetical protein